MNSTTMTVGGEEVEIVRKKIRNLHLRVLPSNDKLLVSAPIHASEASIRKFVEGHLDWVAQQRQRLSNRPSVELVTQAELLQETQKLIEYWSEQMGVQPEKVRMRDMKTRWGTCNTSTKVITVNKQLAKYPPECLEYIVVHELTHLKVQAHNAEFWQIVAKHLPDYKARRGVLR